MQAAAHEDESPFLTANRDESASHASADSAKEIRQRVREICRDRQMSRREGDPAHFQTPAACCSTRLPAVRSIRRQHTTARFEPASDVRRLRLVREP